jgi:hypothetical protein
LKIKNHDPHPGKNNERKYQDWMALSIVAYLIIFE